MADWPIWVWVLIAVVAVLIIAAIIFGTRRKDEIDEGGPFAQEHNPGNDSLTPRRGTTEPDAAVEPVASGAVTPGRRAEDSIDEDEETLTGPLTVPADAPATPAEPASEELRMASEPVEDFAAEAPAAPGEPVADPVVDPSREHPDQTAGDPPPQRPEDDFAPDEPVVAEPDGMASQNPQSHFEAPPTESSVEPDVVAHEGRAVEPVPETAPAPATEDPTPDAVSQSPDDDDPPEHDFAPPKHAASADHGDPVGDVEADDDVPRDDLGRRLDPYGNPVD